MTETQIPYLYQQMLDSPYINRAIKESNYSTVFRATKTNNQGTKFYDIGKGFDEKYELPASKGGRYITQSDIENIAIIGCNEGRKMLHGESAIYNSDVQSTIGGYPKYAVIYNREGERWISKKENNNNSLPNSGEESEVWGKLKCCPSFFTSYPSGLSDTYSSQSIYLRNLNVRIDEIAAEHSTTGAKSWPKGSLTGKFALPIIQYYRGGSSTRFQGVQLGYIPERSYILMLRNVLIHSNFKDSEYGKAVPIWGKTDFFVGHIRILISEYDDILTNPEHQDEYVVASSVYGYYAPYPLQNYYVHQAPTQIIPLKGGATYYFYLDCKNLDLNTRFSEIVFDKGVRKLYWPKV